MLSAVISLSRQFVCELSKHQVILQIPHQDSHNNWNISHDLCRLCTDWAEQPPSFSVRQRYTMCTTHVVHISSVFTYEKKSIFQGRSNVIVRSCSQFEVWSGSPSTTSPTPPPSSPLSVLLFGFAGSKKHQLEKHSKLYNELGYRTLYCILPLQHLFHYDVHRIRCPDKTKYYLQS